MFGSLGVPEILFLLVLALLIFGPRKLPQIGRTLGKGLAEFRKASNELRRSLNTDDLRDDLRQSDPRRMLREELSRPFTSTEKPDPDDEPKSPAETVARTPADGSPEEEAKDGDGPAAEAPDGDIAEGDKPA